jgi:hypothetical protein
MKITAYYKIGYLDDSLALCKIGPKVIKGYKDFNIIGRFSNWPEAKQAFKKVTGRGFHEKTDNLDLLHIELKTK